MTIILYNIFKMYFFYNMYFYNIIKMYFIEKIFSLSSLLYKCRHLQSTTIYSLWIWWNSGIDRKWADTFI